MVYALQITKTANKQLDKLPYKVQEQIRTSLIELAGNPYAASLDVKKLKNQSYYRLRVGSCRVIYELRNRPPQKLNLLVVCAVFSSSNILT